MNSCCRDGTLLSSPEGIPVVPINDTVAEFVMAGTADEGETAAREPRGPLFWAYAVTGWAASDASTHELTQDPAHAAIAFNRGFVSMGGRRRIVTMRREDSADG
jgi:hypothetical protein